MIRKVNGYIIEPHKKEGFIIKKDGVVVCSQPSEEFAYKWIDEELKRLGEEINNEKH